MAYPDLEMERQLADSNQQQRDAYARKPVIPNQPKPGPDLSDPMTQVGFGVQGQGMPESSGGFSISKAMDARLAANKAAAGLPEPVKLDPNLNVVRSPGAIESAAKTAAAPAAVIADAPVAAPQSVIAAPQETPYDPAADRSTAGVMSAMGAAEQKAMQDRTQGALAATNTLQAGVDKAKLEGEARVAKWQATNGADMVLRGGSRAEKAAIVANAAQADAALNAANGNVITAQAAQQKPGTQVADNAVTQQVIQNATAGANQAAGAATDQKLKGLQVENAKRLNDLGASLLSAKTPEERNKISANILTLLGKDKPEQYLVNTVNLPDSFDQNTGVAIRGGQRVIITDRATGKNEIVDPNNLPGAAAKPAGQGQYKEGEVRIDQKTGQKAKYVNGTWVAA